LCSSLKILLLLPPNTGLYFQACTMMTKASFGLKIIFNWHQNQAQQHQHVISAL
jgi:hypothetical protein